VRVRGGQYRLRRLLRHRRRAVAAGLAMTAAALVAATGPADAGRAPAQSRPPARPAAPRPARPAAQLVTAPVRIADAAAARLLHPGDRVDVIAADASGAAGAASPRVVAAGARVVKVPGTGGDAAESGALVLLSVPRPIAAELAGAGAASRLAVTLC
jgi:hypothetical protein